MNVTNFNYTLSVNIIRDQEKSLNYIPTSNSKRIYSQLIENYKSGFSSFSLIGPYGTGKSAFLWAFEQQLKKRELYFEGNKEPFNGIENYEIINFIGDYSSFMDSFAKKFKIKKYTSPDDIVQNFAEYYHNNLNDDTLLVIALDEFGKHLEYSSSNEPEKEMYFIQLLTEFINDDKNNIIFITVLHQNFDSYGESLNFHQKQEWNKVRGRLKELPFNEPVEQLISLAAEFLSKSNKKYTDYNFENFDTVYEMTKRSKLLPIKSEINKELAEKLLPFDLLGAAVLTISLQKYGQNERSLFSFLNSNDYLGINDYDFDTNTYYNISSVYDYLLNNYYSFIFTKYNPHFTQWSAIRTAVERVEGLFDKEITDAAKIIKTIGLLNIFAPESASLAYDFICSYSLHVLNIYEPKAIIDRLISAKIIRFAEYKKKYILFEGTDIDIDHVLTEASSKVDKNINITSELNKYFDFPYEMAKRVSLEKGTPRFFQYFISEEPILNTSKLKVDGIINLIFSFDYDLNSLIETSIHGDPILYGYFKKSDKITNLIWEINKIKYVLENNTHDDHVAKKELNKILSYQVDLLNTEVLGSFYNDNNVIWIFNGQIISINKYKIFNDQLSEIINTIFQDTPTFRNELINREKLAGAITVARKNYFSALVNSWDKKDLGFPEDKFPPEKMIFYTLLKNTRIHKKNDTSYSFTTQLKNNSFTNLWEASEQFIKDAKIRKKSLYDFFELLQSKPFGLRWGFLEFWIPTFLFIKRNDYALFIEDRYQPFLNEDIFEMFIKIPKKIHIKSFSVEGVKLDLFNKYRQFIKASNVDITNATFIETIKPFLVFYKKLPEYSKKTRKLSSPAIKVREAIANSTDPESTFFEEFPKALGYLDITNPDENFIKGYAEKLQDAINEIKSSYDELLNEIEKTIIHSFGESKIDLNQFIHKARLKYSHLQEYKLSSKQKAFISRITNDLSDREKWLSSVCQILINKLLDNITDEEYPLLIERVKSAFSELNDLFDISHSISSPELDDINKVTISAFGKDSLNRVISVPKKKNKEILELESKIKELLQDDNETNLAALLNIFKQELKK